MIKTVVLTDGQTDAILAPLSNEVLTAVLTDVLAGARARWVQLAQARFNSTAATYIAGIQDFSMDELTGTIELVGEFPNDLENGREPYDMRSTLLTSPKAKTNKKGQKYMAIPFRHQTPGSKGRAGAPMGSNYSGHPGVKNASALGKRIHKAARGLQPYKSGGNTRLVEGLAPLLKSHHKTDIYAGMIRQEKKYGKGSQNTYMTFRTISEANPEGWRHPGYEGANLANQVAEFASEIAAEMIGALFS